MLTSIALRIVSAPSLLGVAQEAGCGWERTAREITGPASVCDMTTIKRATKGGSVRD